MAGRGAKVLAALCLVAGGIVGAHWWNARGDAPAPAAPVAAPATKPRAAPVVELAAPELLRAEPRDLVRSLRVSGSTNPSRRASITGRVAGRIEALPVQIGDRVEEGALLVRFERADLESAERAASATLEARRAQERLAQSVLDRSQRLGASGIASEATLLSAKADLLNLQAQVRALEAQVDDARRALAETEIRAPFAGTVSERPVEPGSSVALNTELLALVDLGSMEVEAMVPTNRIGEVKVGQRASFQVEGWRERTFEARVARIAPVAVAGSRAVRVFLSIDNAQGALRGGMFAVGTIELERVEDKIALPNGAIRHDERGSFVLAAVGDRLERRAVQVGDRFEDEGLTVVDGLQPGDRIVAAPLPDLKPDTAFTVADVGS